MSNFGFTQLTFKRLHPKHRGNDSKLTSPAVEKRWLLLCIFTLHRKVYLGGVLTEAVWTSGTVKAEWKRSGKGHRRDNHPQWRRSPLGNIWTNWAKPNWWTWPDVPSATVMLVSIIFAGTWWAGEVRDDRTNVNATCPIQEEDQGNDTAGQVSSEVFSAPACPPVIPEQKREHELAQPYLIFLSLQLVVPEDVKAPVKQFSSPPPW